MHCSECGREISEGAKFCPNCGAKVVVKPPSVQARRMVTALFTDVTGSTSMGEGLDPETLQALMSRYFGELSPILTAHGGTIEKFIGDAIVAVFGIPVVHEDDALRAVRAAYEMRQALEKLNVKLREQSGIEIRNRTGINTGEVVAGDPTSGSNFSTGDTMNVAARLEQKAEPGEIIISEMTYRLVRDAVIAEELEPLALKGKAEGVPAYKLVEVDFSAAGTSRHLDSPMVGRESELQTLLAEFERCVEERSCRLQTVYGPAGVGKSRLTAEFVENVSGKSVVMEGRCLPYGEGITYWALAEALKDIGQITDEDSAQDARTKLAGLLPEHEDRAIVIDRLMEVMGLKEGTAESNEIFWAARRFLEFLALERPVAVVFDDIHWAEPTFLDLLEYLAGWSQNVPIFVLCPARPELLDIRPQWGARNDNMGSFELSPLSEAESEALIANMLGESGLPSTAASRITHAAEGNPLFVEEMLRMFVDEGTLRKENGRWILESELEETRVPPSIHALLAARLDRLEGEERIVIQEAAVIGKVFWWGAISALSPDGLKPAVSTHLQTLVRKELIFPERSSFPGDDAFAFSHILMRDAAYDGLPKKSRAEMHDRFANWLTQRAGDRVTEYQEILAYHLEQSAKYYQQLHVVSDQTQQSGKQAADMLAASGTRALSRGDMPAAANLLERAAKLLEDDDPQKVELLLQATDPLLEMGEIQKVEGILEGILESPTITKDPRISARAKVAMGAMRLQHDEDVDGDELMQQARAAIAIFEMIGDEFGLTKAHLLLLDVHWDRSEYRASEEVLEAALDHARKAKNEREEARILGYLAAAMYWGPTNSEEALRRSEEILASAAGNRLVEGRCGMMVAGLLAMRGDFDRARELSAKSTRILDELGMSFAVATSKHVSGIIEMMAGDPVAAEAEFRRGSEALEDIGDRWFLVSMTAFLARALFAQGRYEEADAETVRAEELSDPDDPTAKADWAITRAKVLAQRGEFEAAEALGREAVAIRSQTDEITDHADALMDLCYVLEAAGKKDDAAAVAEQAIQLYETKGVLPALDRTRAILSTLRG
jgi:predicted ATPase/class 3 adenylate cyclase